MSFDYAKSAATALRLLQQFGQAVTRNASTAGAYDPATGASVVTNVASSRTGALLNYSGKGEVYANGNLVILGDKKLLLGLGGQSKKYRNIVLWFTAPPTAGPTVRIAQLKYYG